MQEKIAKFAANVTLGGSLIFLFLYSLIITIALIVFIARSGDTPADIEQMQQINAQIDAASGKGSK